MARILRRLIAALLFAAPVVFVSSPRRSTTPRHRLRAQAGRSDIPETNPQGIRNRFWQWRGQRIRYQALGEENDGPSVLLVHGLFVNADHWRQNMPALADAGFRVYSIDLLGYGYSSKPPPTSEESLAINGENGRRLGSPFANLGTAWGGERLDVEVPLSHPLGSVYNFYTWSEQLRDFAREVIRGPARSIALVANSIGSISGLQAALDEAELFNGLMILNPNFRELHVAEQPDFLPPIVSAVQGALRENGQGLFDFLAKKDIVKQILKEPYHDPSTVTDELVDVLLSPLLTPGAADVVFDTLSYSAGPLPEQLLADPRMTSFPVWVCLGDKDPWTPAKRVRALDRFLPVRRIDLLPGIGHCPHDEAPDVVNPLLIEFVRQLPQPDSQEVAPLAA
ncbi:unnamed protein product [Effrenium voratum]|uniref:AB hydrolase-1 domain-containing protein n=1 Tax=Effrenium voratum TaxID=2562239 RepID=A0AA36MXA2_9DINO|nr:unnamed protein product [Effrenium voratum]CAJ1413140.1 unnamed protein product [Effrenium voratum]